MLLACFCQLHWPQKDWKETDFTRKKQELGKEANNLETIRPNTTRKNRGSWNMLELRTFSEHRGALHESHSFLLFPRLPLSSLNSPDILSP